MRMRWRRKREGGLRHPISSSYLFLERNRVKGGPLRFPFAQCFFRPLRCAASCSNDSALS